MRSSVLPASKKIARMDVRRSLTLDLNCPAPAGTLWWMSARTSFHPFTRLAVLVLVVAVVMPVLAGAQSPASRAVNGPAIAMYGDLKYQPGFKHFQYVNPEAPKGGDVKMAAFGTFDTLNPFTLKGVP